MLVEIVFAQPRSGRLLVDPDYAKINWSTHHLDTLPRWIQGRIAMLRLLEEREESPLGAWFRPTNYTPARDDVQAIFAIVRQPDDPEWGE